MTPLRTAVVALSLTVAFGPSASAHSQAASATPPAAAMSKEVTALQGTWDVTLMNDQAPGDGAIALQFEGMKYAVIMNGGVDETGTFKLDASKTPWTFDLTILEGGDAGQVQLGILEMKDGALHGVFGVPGAGTRPSSFASADGAVSFVAQKRK